SVGAGPIDAALSKFFIRSALGSSAWTSVRDAYSQQIVRSIGVDRSISICPDLGFGLPDAFRPTAAAAGERGDGPVVGLNVMAHRDPRYWPRGDWALYEAYVRKMASFTQWLGENGYTARFFSSQTRSDPAVVEDVRSLLTAPVASALGPDVQ